MPRRPEPEPTPFAKATNAAIRRILADRRISQAEVERGTVLGATYIAERLRDEKSFTLTDMEVLGQFFGFEPQQFLLAVSAEMRRNVGTDDDTSGIDDIPVLTRDQLQQEDLGLAAHRGDDVTQQPAVDELPDQEGPDGDDARPGA